MKVKIPRAMSGLGKELLDKVHKPLLGISLGYDRVSSYFNAKSFVRVSKELESLWNSGGKVRLILSPANQGEIGLAAALIREAFERQTSPEKYWQMEVEQIVRAFDSQPIERVKAFKEAIQKGILEVNVARPRGKKNANFHSKFAIYKINPTYTNIIERKLHSFRTSSTLLDYSLKGEKKTSGPFAIFHGSVNETGPGWDKNIEDLSTHRSWVWGESEVACVFYNRFEKLWNNMAEDTEIIPLTAMIESEFERQDGESEGTSDNNLTIERYLSLLSCTPPGSSFSKKMWLLPHQARVANAALCRTNIRAMFCDEVGLGKTLEALGVIEHLLTSRRVSEFVIVVPARLMEQWAISLNQFLTRACYLHRKKRFELWDDETAVDRIDSVDFRPKGHDELSLIRIFSSQWLARQEPVVVEQIVHGTQMVIMDEAHHARCHDYESKDGTKLWKRIRTIKDDIEHMLLLTATPYQTSSNDYIGLLDLMVELDKEKLTELDDITNIVTADVPWKLQQQSKLLTRIHGRIEQVSHLLTSELYQEICGYGKIQHEEVYEIVKKFKDELTPSLMYDTSIVSTYTFRHTRDMIKDDFKFPNVEATNIRVSLGDYSAIIKEINDYIIHHLGGNSGNGFVKSIYYQRVVSSLAAMRNTLENRLLKKANNDIETESELEGRSKEDRSDSFSNRNEKIRLKTLIEKIKRMNKELSSDPKIDHLLELVLKFAKEQRQVLVFSRFTDTTAEIERILNQTDLSIARFDGTTTRIRPSGETEPHTISRKELIKLMFEYKIDVVVCSDAASEGLNLQSASVLINVDVPWNPARLLQRIGRIDRLGQESNMISIINLFYDNTIECRMYHKLDGRQTDGIRLLGNQPEIFNTAESRELFRPTLSSLDVRQDEEQGEIRQNSMQTILNRFTAMGPASFITYLCNCFGHSPDPANQNFVLLQEEVTSKNIDLSTLGKEFEIGWLGTTQCVTLALCLKMNGQFLSLCPTNISLILQGESVDTTWASAEECLQSYWEDFGCLSEQQELDVQFNKILVSG
jgi:SNF2 family DNA or RNA helicase